MTSPINAFGQIREIAGKRPESRTNILFEIVNKNQAHIIFNRPSRMNAFSFEMYETFTEYIEKANEMEEIKYIVIKGAGNDFSSGNDLSNFVDPEIQAIENKYGLVKAMSRSLEDLGTKIVRSRKPIFSLVQGKVIGFAFTQLALYDKVFAVKGSYFMAPLVKIAQGP